MRMPLCAHLAEGPGRSRRDGPGCQRLECSALGLGGGKATRWMRVEKASLFPNRLEEKDEGPAEKHGNLFQKLVDKQMPPVCPWASEGMGASAECG